MQLLEFITFCTIKGYVISKENVNSDWDTEASSHWKIVIANGNCKTHIAYAVVATEHGDVGVVIDSSLTTKTTVGTEFSYMCSLSLIMDCILSSK